MNRRYRIDESSIESLAKKNWTKYSLCLYNATTIYLKKNQNTLPIELNAFNSLITYIHVYNTETTP